MTTFYKFKRLDKWPEERTRTPKVSRFSASWSSTVTLLASELDFLDAKNTIIQADCDDSEIRLDGMLRAGAKLRSQGVILSFDSKHGPLSYPCDSFTKYQDNVRAIALALQSLRTVDRYGVTKRAEQYKGWKKLPGATTLSTDLSMDMALQFLTLHSGKSAYILKCGVGPVREAFRDAAKKLHPDKPGGDAELMKTLIKAKERLYAYHGHKGT